MRLGYDFKILSSSKLTNPEFRKTAFVKLPQYINDTLPGTNAEEKDPELAKAFITWLDERDKEKPFYAFLYFDAPHGPYSYPDQFEKFKPSNKSPNYVTTGRKDAVPLFNSYKNAVFFDDFLTGKILNALRKHGLMTDTIILITGDHGEEFFEVGNWGHTSDFSKYQARVSCVLYIPGYPHQEITYPTSHLDVAPTFLKMLGYSTPVEKYSQGQDLFTPGGNAHVMVSGWSDCAIIDPQNTIVLPTETYNAGSSEVRTTDTYQLVPDENAVFEKKQDTIMAVMKKMGVFLK
jgi:membrane-anchored protein YejM (alkaline phosphatase superfamily)